MNIGDTIICRRADGYAFTLGKEYTVLLYEAEFFDDSVPAGFTWPAYVYVEDDLGRKVACHANRFELKP